MRSIVGWCVVWVVMLGLFPRAESPVEPLVEPEAIRWLPLVAYQSALLRVVTPDGVLWDLEFGPGEIPAFEPGQMGRLPDGIYLYELRLSPEIDPVVQRRLTSRRENGQGAEEGVHFGATVSGSFALLGGVLLDPGRPESGQWKDQVIADDLIVQGSLCVGFDCVNNESFGFDTFRLKENNLRIHFDDSSATAGFPSNDWRIIINDSAQGGANYFAIEDSTASRMPFRIQAGARHDGLVLSSTGRVGLGTATPVLDLHMVRGDTPAMRLDQTSSSGWTPQVWDVAGNESNFFIRDVTFNSRLPFRIQPETPTNTLTLRQEGRVGIGTWSPSYPVEVQRTGENAALAVARTDGATALVQANPWAANFGSVSNHNVNLFVNSIGRLQLRPDNRMVMASGAVCTAGGVWTNASSIRFKDNVQTLDVTAARATLNALRPVTFTYKTDPAERHAGFIAEEVPELVATADREGLSPMDIVAVLTRVMQEQQQVIAQLERKVAELDERLRRDRD